MENNEKKGNAFVQRSKAACSEVGGAFKALSMDAKILVCVVIGLLVAGIICSACGSGGDASLASSNEDSLLDDAKKSLSESYHKGLDEAMNDSEVKQELQGVKENCKKLNEAAGELKGAMQGLGF